MVAPNEPVRKVAIVGGGTAGWLTAAALSRALQDRFCEIHLIESTEIGTVGVGEATIPPIVQMNRLLGIDENEFVARTGATFKVGIEFIGWSGPESRYFHPFGQYGTSIGPIAFSHYWRRLQAERGGSAGTLDDYSITALAARAGRFQPSVGDPGTPPQLVTYAYHFDAGLYAAFLRQQSEARGVIRHDRRIVGHRLAGNGFVEALLFDGGDSLEADFYIDCSGFPGILIEQAIGTGYEDWSHWLPCDRAVVVPSARMDDQPPYTRATARTSGWQWRIPLQNRTGNGHVYCSRFISDDEAAAELLANLPTEAIGEPRLLRFSTGRRKLCWNRNVVAMGLASGFIEPLESTSIHLVQTAVEKLLNLFPDRGFRQADIDFFNRVTATEFQNVRDFLILHYWANARSEPFWQERQALTLPDTLRERIELYRGYGRIFRHEDELFSPVSWTAVLEGQGIHAASYDPMTLGMPLPILEDTLQRMRAILNRWVESMPSHADYVARACAAATRSGINLVELAPQGARSP